MAVAHKIQPDEALEILRRLEPVLNAVVTEQKELRGEVQRHGEAIARIDGRLTEMSSKTPTIWQIVGAVLGINSGIMALGFALAKLLTH